MSVRFTHVRLRLDEPRIADVRAHMSAALAGCGVRVAAGSEIAIGLGSRGIRDLGTVVACVVEWVRAHGAHPFIVPAMGSHGGGTADGQREVLEAYGFDPSFGVEVRSSMDVVSLPKGPSAVPVWTDAVAARAAGTILINRVKQHTDFHGPVESGLVKMAAIGLGKTAEADALHAYGVRGLRELMPIVGAQVIAHGNLVLGVAIVENALDETMAVEAIQPPQWFTREAELLALAREHAPRLPIEDLDVLLVDRMGKDISGVGMDTNVIGRMMIAGQEEPVAPRIRMIACHSLTPASHGNATGMGLADVVTREFADAVDHEVTRTNIVTSGFLLRGKLPVVADDDRHAWDLCLRGAGIVDSSVVRAARIVDTLHCSELWVTDAVLADLCDNPRVEVVADGLALHGTDGRLTLFG